MSGSPGKYPGLPPLPPAFAGEQPPVALVIEEKCIGCDRCPPLCFFDALAMRPRPDHPFGTVAEVIAAHCTGCGLCFEACPVDAFVWIPGKNHPLHPGPQRSPRKETADDSH